jgi:hypothetical protein
MANRLWEVEFSAETRIVPLAKVPYMRGTIAVVAKDIFEALDLAKKKSEEFGFDYFAIEGAKNAEVQNEGE